MEQENGNGQGITAKQIREKFNIPYSKINYYTDLGFFPIVRKDGNRRIYDLRAVQARYRKIAKLANEGYPLGLIRRKLLGRAGHELL